jgi:hypothetical protein
MHRILWDSRKTPAHAMCGQVWHGTGWREESERRAVNPIALRDDELHAILAAAA